MKRIWWSLVCILALGAGGCDGGGGGDTDSGTPPVDSGPMVEVVTATEGDSQVPADFSCSPTRPAGAGESTFTIRAIDFEEDFPVEGLTVEFFPDNQPTLDGTCEGTCQTVVTDASGEATVTGTAGAWYAYRVIAGNGRNVESGTEEEFIDVVQVNEVTPENGGEATLNVIRRGTRQRITLILGISLEEGTAVVTGQATDCMGRPISNATVRVFDSVGEIDLAFAGPGPRAFYFNGRQIPWSLQRDTNTDGLYGAANLPLSGDNTFRVETWGTLEEGGDPQMLGCEEVQGQADGITILSVGPARADGPSSCSG